MIAHCQKVQEDNNNNGWGGSGAKVCEGKPVIGRLQVQSTYILSGKGEIHLPPPLLVP